MEEKGHKTQHAKDNLSVALQDLVAPLERYVDTTTKFLSEISTPPSQSQEDEDRAFWLERENRGLKNQIQTMLHELNFHIAELKAWREKDIMSGHPW